MVPLHKILNAFLLLHLLFSKARCFEYEDAHTPNVTFSSSASGSLLEIVEDNNLERITFLKVTKIGGKNLILDISTIVQPIKDLLDIKLVKVAGDKDVMLLQGNRLDFEKLLSPSIIRLGIYESEGASKDIRLKILNIDDEPPKFTASTGCTMRENTTITISNVGDFTEDCFFEIYDADGWLSKTDFKKITNPAASELFSFKFKTIPADDVYSSPVYLVLNKDKLLDYEKVTMHIFEIEVKDGAGHSTVPTENVQILVKVEDINDETPMWVRFVPAVRITEKKKHTINILAKDGDFGINDAVLYKQQDSNEFVSIDAQSGRIEVGQIDRDVRDGANDIITLSVIAYEKHAPDWSITGNITLIVEDIDDHIPQISIPGAKDGIFTAVIAENKSDPIDLVITIEDRDLGENAMYQVELIDIPDSRIEYSKAFQIVPSNGYQEGKFFLNVKDVSKLDYDSPNEDWRQIRFKIRSQENIMKSMSHEFEMRINLTDWNDEFPVFEKPEYVIEVNETIPINQIINKDPIKATDRDSVDRILKHTLVGPMAASILEIDPEGFIRTKTNRSFDHERQPEVLVQIRAVDKANHIARTQLRIKVLDVNDKPPQILVDQVGVTMKEKLRKGTELSFKIRAFDEDSNPNLKFSIDWERSYVTKNGVKLKNKPEFRWLRVETASISKQEAAAKLIVTPANGYESNTPDYKVYDTSYVALKVIDYNTEVGSYSSSVTLVINIENGNL